MDEQSQRRNREPDLHLDRVVASQPEIGPTPPDGGYGWLIVASAMVYHITAPGLLTLYGLIVLKSLRDEDHEEGEKLRIWDVDIALVPVLMLVIKLLLDSWCKTVVSLVNMPRFMALAGLCMTVAGVLLSSFSTNADENDHIVNVFAGICAGAGCALTGQQTEVIITHYFRDKLTIAQRLVRIAPSIGNCFIPVLIGYLCTKYTGSVVVTIYAAVLMQNCFFLASFTRPVYIEKVIRNTYNMLKDAVEDDDEVIFSNQRQSSSQANTVPNTTTAPGPSQQNEDNDDSIVVFNSNKNAKEIIDPSIQIREDRRFSSDFSATDITPNRFSSNFADFDISSYRYQELENIDREAQNPQPLYRETTVDASQNSLAFAVNAEMTPGTARRTASVKKNLITLANMLVDINFYLYILLHLCTTFSMLMLGVIFPPMIWEKNPTMNIWSVSALIAVVHAVALSFITLCVVMPKSINEKARLCSVFCITGALGFYGATLTTNKSFLVAWGIFASVSTASSGILQQPLSNNCLNEFDTTATHAAANTLVAAFLMIWSVVYNYDYSACFVTAGALQAVTGAVFLAASLRRRR